MESGSCSFFYHETIKGCLELEKVVEDNIYGIFYHFDGLRNFENFGGLLWNLLVVHSKGRGRPK